MRKLTQQEFVDKCNLVHDEKYDYSLLEYKNSRSKINIICKKHGIFSQLATSHVSGQGCRECYKDKLRGRVLSTDEFIKKAIETHGSKYDYSLVEYRGGNTRVIISCKKHGNFTQIPSNHTTGSGCPKCGKEKVRKSISSNTKEFVLKAGEVHGNVYDYSLVEYKNSNEYITIVCKYHGKFKQTPSSHLSRNSGQGCPSCSGKQKITRGIFIERSLSKNGKKYDYSFVGEIKNNREKVILSCPDHGKFHQSVDGHLNQNQGCPHCKESKGEKKISIILKNKGIEFERQKRFCFCVNPKTNRQLPFDFYIPEHKVCIEFDGRQHYYPVKKFGGKQALSETQKRDEIKNEFCLKDNIRLFRIKYNDNIDKKLNDIIKIF